MKLKKQMICDYMHYAAIYRVEKAEDKARWYEELLRDENIPTFRASELGSVRELLRQIISDHLQLRRISEVKIGISAGMDSRGILAGLVDVLPKSRIWAYTNGEPGNPDFETARLYTEKVLDNHLFFEQTEGVYTAEHSLEKVKDRIPGTAWQLSGQSRSTMPKDVSKLKNFHGFLGDSISGKRLKKDVSMDWTSAVESFVSSNNVFKSSKLRVGEVDLGYDWLPKDYDPFHIFPSKPFLSNDQMTFYDQLDLCYRQEQRIRHGAKKFYLHEVESAPESVRSRLLKKRSDVLTVYDDPRWQKSFLSLPPEQRLKQNFLRKAWAYNFPDIFRDLTGEINLEARRKEVLDRNARYDLIARTASHTNWERQWETNHSFRKMVRVLFRSLSSRKLIDWFEPMDILAEIENSHNGLGREIFGVCSVELGIRAGHLPDSI